MKISCYRSLRFRTVELCHIIKNLIFSESKKVNVKYFFERLKQLCFDSKYLIFCFIFLKSIKYLHMANDKKRDERKIFNLIFVFGSVQRCL
jgi:hypothetical protein